MGIKRTDSGSVNNRFTPEQKKADQNARSAGKKVIDEAYPKLGGEKLIDDNPTLIEERDIEQLYSGRNDNGLFEDGLRDIDQAYSDKKLIDDKKRIDDDKKRIDDDKKRIDDDKKRIDDDNSLPFIRSRL
ncbi:hypothetical protein M3P05_17905 [Sansalvadorimonas sp. 2012CJ34-2]|uniref:Uncharacterized protein n=1 Tax=Parendozoicomonas callyspongiae TaxID=2942213 RepID=A0ABT0PK78_9GAMM|nr:hypothetical protein [Sansalvadorimonas sp. 2012CJ34-2]MCL6271797.1 hypothetical protein [Sansalvadorimonas sp. 2012CJ34-2]